MGNSIYAYFENKNPKTGQWDEITDTLFHDQYDRPGDTPTLLRIGNFYRWLGFDYRLKHHHGIEPIAPPRGFPDDYIPRESHDETDQWAGADQSWLTAEEIIDARLLPGDLNAGDVTMCLELKECMRRLKEKYGGDVRMVFSFKH